MGSSVPLALRKIYVEVDILFYSFISHILVLMITKIVQR